MDARQNALVHTSLRRVVGVVLVANLAYFFVAGLEVALSFGAAALLYLVTEELLVEAHEVPETTFSIAMFFLGFLILLIIDMVSQSSGSASAQRGGNAPPAREFQISPT